MTTSASIADPLPASAVPLSVPLEQPAATGLDDPEALGHRFAEAVSAGDLDALVALYAADAVVTLPGGREAAGSTAIRAAFAKAFARGADLRVASVGRAIISGELACTTTTDPTGRVQTQVARRESDGTWRWTRDGSRLREIAPEGSAGLG